MNAFAYESRCVAVGHPDGDLRLVAFADSEHDTQVYLLLQRALEFDEQDAEHGMDSYHVEWCGQGQSGYGGIAGFVLFRDGAEVTFEPRVAEALDGLEQVSVFFELDDARFAELRDELAHIFAGEGIFAVQLVDESQGTSEVP